MNKRNYSLFFLISTVLLLFLSGCSQETPNLKEKTKSEIDYFSVKLINVLNRLNNITFVNYDVTTEKTELSKESAENEKTSETSSQGSSSSPADVKSSESGASQNNNIIAFQMSPNTILNPITTDVDWVGIKNELENLYFSWNTVILDLYELDVANDDILGFSSDMDVATKYIKNEDRTNSILAVANLYKYLPKYAEVASDEESYKNIIKTKSFILNSYAFVDTEYWEAVTTELDKALEAFKLVSTDAKYVSENSYKANKVYVLLNELRNSLDLKDKEIFYIKYRNLMEEITEM